MKWVVCFIAIMGIGLVSCSNDESNGINGEERENLAGIIYENDVHCAVDGYAKMATVRTEQVAKANYTTTVSCGDFVQGGMLASISKGEYSIDIMNKVGYDVVTFGNHEFDFGVERMMTLMEQLDAKVVNCNYKDLRTGDYPFAPYEIVDYGDVDVAFIGFVTPSSLNSYCKDEQGEYICDFSKAEFYELAQTQIDNARNESAEYVVALSHLGDVTGGDNPTSVSLIESTSGLDVVLDGHSHSYISSKTLKNKSGESVLLSSTGTQFEAIGVLTLTHDGVFSCDVVSSEGVEPDSEIQSFVNQIREQNASAGNEIVGKADVTLSIYTTEAGEKSRIIRTREVGIGNFCADAARVSQNADVAVINGGGIRSDIEAGDITLSDLYDVYPFDNAVCRVRITGAQLLNVLEYSVSVLPKEQGSFMQVSGMRFDVDTTVKSPVLYDEDDMYNGVKDAPRRVSNLQILNSSGGYDAVVLDKIYTIASFDYLLKEDGGDGILAGLEVDDNAIENDVQVLKNYIQTSLNGVIGENYSQTEGRRNIH